MARAAPAECGMTHRRYDDEPATERMPAAMPEREPESGLGPDVELRPAGRWHQLYRAQDFLLWLTTLPDAARRAAVILRAREDAPELERAFGAKAAAELIGQSVRCVSCGRQWEATVEDPYLNPEYPHYAGPGDDSPAEPDGKSGYCASCVTLVLSRHPDAVAPLDGEIVRPAKARRTGKLVRGASAGRKAAEADGDE